jgi:hypothetical protein
VKRRRTNKSLRGVAARTRSRLFKSARPDHFSAIQHSAVSIQPLACPISPPTGCSSRQDVQRMAYNRNAL